MNGPLGDYVQRLTERLARREAAKTELDILTGCRICGRRLVENDKPIEGAILASVQDSPVRIPVCSTKCLNKIQQELCNDKVD